MAAIQQVIPETSLVGELTPVDSMAGQMEDEQMQQQLIVKEHDLVPLVE